MRSLQAAAVAAFGLIGTGVCEASGERVALVIGNANYVEERSLSNPHRDADAFAKVLVEKLQFQRENVVIRKDATFETLIGDLQDLQRRAVAAEVAVIFYSGHGIAFNDANYLAPVDVPRHLVMSNSPSDRVVHLDELQNAIAGARVGLLFWDACRTNSVEPTLDSRGRQTSATRGLIPVAPQLQGTNAVATFIAFSTNPRQTADDGVPGELSPFTGALIRRITTRGMTFMNVMGQVSGDVSAATAKHGRQQLPEVRVPKITPAAVTFALLPPMSEQTGPPASKVVPASSGGSGSSPGRAPPSSGRGAPARSGGGSVGPAPGAGGGAGLF